MEARPPVLIDAVVRALIPAAAREAIVGDLWEHYRSPLQYASEALRLLPFVIVSRLRRTANVPSLGIVGFTFFVSFGGFAVNAVPLDIPRWLRAAVPTIAALIALVLRDAYRSEQNPMRRAALDVLTAVLLVVTSQAALFALSANALISMDWILTFPPQRAILAIAGVGMVFCLRIWVEQGLPNTAHDVSAADLVREYHQFERSVLWRRRRELVGVLGGLVTAAGLFLQAADLTPRIGWAVSVALALAIAWYLARKTSVEPLPEQSSFAFSLALYRRELERQTSVLRSVAWLWCLTIIPPVVAEVAARGLTVPSQPALHPVQVGGYLLICFFVGWLYMQHARALQQRSEALAGLAERD